MATKKKPRLTDDEIAAAVRTVGIWTQDLDDKAGVLLSVGKARTLAAAAAELLGLRKKPPAPSVSAPMARQRKAG